MEIQRPEVQQALIEGRLLVEQPQRFLGRNSRRPAMGRQNHAGQLARSEGNQHPAAGLNPPAQGFGKPVSEGGIDRDRKADIAVNRCFGRRIRGKRCSGRHLNGLYPLHSVAAPQVGIIFEGDHCENRHPRPRNSVAFPGSVGGANELDDAYQNSRTPRPPRIPTPSRNGPPKRRSWPRLSPPVPSSRDFPTRTGRNGSSTPKGSERSASTHSRPPPPNLGWLRRRWSN